MAATIVLDIPGLSPGLPGGASSALNLTAAQVLKALPGICVKLICVVSGNLTLNDSATTGAATLANEFYAATAAAVGTVVELNFPCAAGITASAATGQWAISFS